MNRTLWIGIGVTALVLAAGAAYAMGHHGPRRMIEARIADAEDYIDATPQQRQVIEQAKENIFAAIKNHRHPDHGKLIDVLAADQLDTDALYAFADQRAQDIQDLAKVIVPEIKKVHDALTPAQRAKLAAKARQRQQRFEGGFGGPPQE